MARFLAAADLVAQQVQDLPAKFEKAHSVHECHSQISHIGERSADRVVRLQGILCSALEALVITGFNGSALTAEAAYIIRHHYHVEVEQMSDEDIGNFIVNFLGSITEDNDALMNEDGSLQEGITLDELRHHVLYVLGRTHMENVVLKCCQEVSKALREYIHGLLTDVEASEMIRAQGTTMSDLLHKPSLIGCDSTISVDLTYKGYYGSCDESDDDVGNQEEPQEEEEGWEDSSDDESVTSNIGHGVDETVPQSQASVSKHSKNAPNDGVSAEAAAKELTGNEGGVSTSGNGSKKS